MCDPAPDTSILRNPKKPTDFPGDLAEWARIALSEAKKCGFRSKHKNAS
jgi:hypothetical protein